MAYIAPIHRPSSVRHALRIKLFSPDEECLVLSKANRLEIWRLQGAEELVLFHSQRVYGTISMLDRLRPRDSETELLFVGTDRFDYFTVAWDAGRQCLQTVDNFHDVGEKHLRDSQSQDRCVVDPSGRYMALLLWEGVLCVLRMRPRRDRTRSNLEWMDQVRLSELFVQACTFLYTETGHPTMALLYQSQSDRQDTRLASYRVTTDDGGAVAARFDPTRDRELDEPLDDIGAALLIPVEADDSARRHNVRRTSSHADAEPHLGGLLVAGETRLLYYDGTTHARIDKVPSTPAVFVAWARFDSTHYFLADDQGVLRLLTLLTAGPVVKKIELQPVGRTSRAASLVYLEPQRLLFVGSHHGDSQLFRINLDGDISLSSHAASAAGRPPPNKRSRFCELVQTMPNIGPVLDFTIMDMGNRGSDDQLANEYASGQSRIVTGSGVHRDGSLRSIRSGVGLDDLGTLGAFPHARALFSLRLRPSTPAGKVDTLVVSFLTDTRVFVFDGDEGIEEVDTLLGGALDTETLAAAVVGGGNTSGNRPRLLRITPAAATLTELDGMTVATWTPPQGQTIISASANDRWALLSVDGKRLVSLRLDADLAVAAHKDFGDDQIASLHAAPQLLDTGVVGTWMQGAVSVIDLATLQSVQTAESIRGTHDTTSVARSMVLVQVLPPRVAGPTLFVALNDGSLVTFAVAAVDRALSSRKSVVLGTHHANLHVLPQADGATCNVLATTNHPTLIYGAEGRIVYAAVTAQDATVVCPFDAEAFPGAVAVATPSAIALARPDPRRQTHVQTMAVGETVRRLAYSPAERVFALGCIAVDAIKGVEVPTCAVRLVDEISFARVGRPLELDSERGELVEAVIRATLPDAHGRPAERFLVGTSYLPDAPLPDAANGTLGRLLVVAVDPARNPYLVAALPMAGPVRCLAELDGRIVVGLSKTVVVADYLETTSLSAKLHRLASFRAATYVVDLAVHHDLATGHRYIAVGDLMKSTTILEFIPGTRGGKDGEGEEGEGHGNGESDNAAADDDDKAKPPMPAQLLGHARHYEASWATAVGHIEGESWLEADGYGNLSVLERNAAGVTDDDRRRMRSTSEMNLGEMVNRIRPIVVEPSPGAMVHPRAFLATVEGSVYMFGTVAPKAQALLVGLQTNLEAVVSGLGNASFSSYRAFRNQEREAAEPYRFLDGEMLERFLDLDDDLQQRVAIGLGPSVEDLRNMVEELKRMH